jgi:hypothetical protein
MEVVHSALHAKPVISMPLHLEHVLLGLLISSLAAAVQAILEMVQHAHLAPEAPLSAAKGHQHILFAL